MTEYVSMHRLKKDGLESVQMWPPIPGHYRLKGSDGRIHAIRIWQGFPVDELTGEFIERGWGWRAMLDGSLIDINDVWPAVHGRKCTEMDYYEALRELYRP